MSKIRFHKIVAVAVLVATAAWVITGEFTSVGSAADEAEAASQTETQERAPVVRTVAVIDPPRTEHARAIRVSGLTSADKRATLGTRAAGVVEDLPIEQGMMVERGDVILKLQAEGKEAAVEMARQLLAQRQAEADATRRLVEQGSLPRLRLDEVLSALASARSQLEAAEADLDRDIVRAPFDGLIDTVEVEEGSTVSAGAQIATLLKLDPIRVVGEVSERDLGHIQAGDRAQVRLVNGQEGEGRIRYISRDANSSTRTFRVEAEIGNEDGTIPAGMTAEITFRGQAVVATALPRSVITLSTKGDLGVRGVDEDNRVVFYPVDLVDDTPNGLMLGGIAEDVRIIVGGQELVSEGDVVNPVQADEDTMNRLVSEATGITF